MEPTIQMVTDNCAMISLPDGTEAALLVQDGKIVFNLKEKGEQVYHREYEPVSGVTAIHYKYR